MERQLTALIIAIALVQWSPALAPAAAAAGRARPGPVKEESPFKEGFESDPAEELNEKVSLLYRQGKYEEALPLARQAVAATEKVSGGRSPQAARALNNLAWLLQATGDYAGARALFEKALAINEETLGSEDAEVATSLNNLAALLSYEGDYASARPLYERALSIQEKALGPDHPALGDTLNNLAVCLESGGQQQASLPVYERALAVAEKSLGPDHPDVATSLNNLGAIYEGMGNLGEARSMFERALKIREKTLGPYHPDLAESLNNLALVKAAQGDSDSAGQLLARALQVYERSLGPDHPDVASALNNLGKLDWRRGRSAEARASFLKAAAIIARHVQNLLPSLSFAEQRAFLQTKIPEEISILLSTCRQGEELAAAYDYIFRWKGLLIESLRWQKAVSSLGRDPRYKEQVDRLQDIRARLASWYHEAGSVPYGEWKSRNDALTRDKESLERDLSRAVTAGAIRDVLADYDLARFRGLLKEDEALVDIYRYQEIGGSGDQVQRYAAVVCGREGPIRSADLGEARAVDAALNGWRKQVLVRNTAEAEWKAAAHLVWDPVLADLPAGARKVFCSPDSQLSKLPWHLVPESNQASRGLMVSQLDSMRELAVLTAEPPARPTAGRPLFLVAGGVDFGHETGDAQGSVLSFKPLPGTLEEAMALKSLADRQGMVVSVLTGREATKSRLLSLLPQASWVHLATHGYFFDEARTARLARRSTFARRTARRPLRNPLVESGIVLAGEDTGGAGSGRFLTAEEMVGLDLGRAELMTLSACETGLGEQATGQGVLGLRASIMAAGARSIVMSLWKVPDESTLKLMQEFYTNLWVKKLPRIEALKKAQEAVRNEPYERFASPIYWAAWVLVGKGW